MGFENGECWSNVCMLCGEENKWTLYLTEGDEREVVGIVYYPTRCQFVSEFDGWVLFQGYQGMEGKMVSKEVYLFTFPFFFWEGGCHCGEGLLYKCWIEWLFWCEEEPRLRRRGRWDGCLPKEIRTWVRVEQVRDFGDGDFF